jgi:hypothetical protein
MIFIQRMFGPMKIFVFLRIFADFLILFKKAAKHFFSKKSSKTIHQSKHLLKTSYIGPNMRLINIIQLQPFL